MSQSSQPTPKPPAQESGATPDQPARRATLTNNYQRDWPRYFDAVAHSPPRDTCLRALAALSESTKSGPMHAIDIACGEGRDTRAILAADLRWHVFATDSSREGLERLRRSLLSADAARVTLTQATMEELAELAPTPRTADFINASFALPFCHPSHFPLLWKWIGATLKPGAIFAGQLFGDRDEWANVRPGSHFTRAAAQNLFLGFELVHFEEVEKDGDDAMGGLKHHHVFHVVAKKHA